MTDRNGKVVPFPTPANDNLPRPDNLPPTETDDDLYPYNARLLGEVRAAFTQPRPAPRSRADALAFNLGRAAAILVFAAILLAPPLLLAWLVGRLVAWWA